MDKCCTDKCHSETYPLIFILLVKSMHQKFLFRKMFVKNFNLSNFRYLGSKNFVGPKKFLTQNYFWPKSSFLARFCFDQNFIRITIFGIIIFLEPKFCEPKIFLDKNYFWTQKFFEPKIILDPNFFSSDQQIFELRIFPQFFWIKIFFCKI